MPARGILLASLLLASLSALALTGACGDGRASAIGDGPESGPSIQDASNGADAFSASPTEDSAVPIGDAGTDAGSCDACEVILQGSFSDLVANGTDLFAAGWVTKSKTKSIGPVLDIPLDGGAPNAFTSDAGGVVALTIDDRNVYWATPPLCTYFDAGPQSGSPSACQSSIIKAPMEGGAPLTLFTDEAAVLSSASDNAGLYWLDWNQILPAPYPTMLIRALPSDGGAATTLATVNSPGPYSPVFTSGGNVYWSDAEICNASACTSRTATVPIAGGPTTTFSSGNVIFAVDSTNAYLVDATSVPGQFVVTRAPLDRSAPTTLVSAPGNPGSFAVGAATLYWTDPDAGTVMSAPFGGGAPTLLAAGQIKPDFLVLTSSGLYWANPEIASSPPSPTPAYPGALVKLPLP